MSVLRGFLWLLIFLLLGQAVVGLFRLPMPSGVIGMLLLTLFFGYRGGMNPDVVHISQPLIAMLALLIMPGVVEIFFVAGQFADQWAAILTALIAGTLLSVLSSLLLMRRYLPASDAPGMAAGNAGHE
ncbi:CidA/LrgA family protein [Salinicola corii]|uniref:CidA/LrgA family protein n=1 Tax=Salinicola corii TaxID=2606937 RepID=A0A640WCE1_9GAMM|nr:CidA/LrgA family protein [Salinicola corii]KAA0015672.1 CidA/LrgA family protein [Salinicola corii]